MPRFFVSLLLLLALIGCTAPAEKAENTAPAPATETTATAPATQTAATTPTTETSAAAPATATTAATPAPAVPATPEAMITAKLVETFGDDGKAIHVTFVDGKATLTGKVNERSTQELAEEVARYFPEVKKVDNQLGATKDRGLGKGQLKDESADASLEKSAKSALSSEIGEYAKNVEVEAAAGVVSLRGTVPDETRHKLAVDSMKKVKEVTKVIDLIRVK